MLHYQTGKTCREPLLPLSCVIESLLPSLSLVMCHVFDGKYREFQTIGIKRCCWLTFFLKVSCGSGKYRPKIFPTDN